MNKVEMNGTYYRVDLNNDPIWDKDENEVFYTTQGNASSNILQFCYDNGLVVFSQEHNNTNPVEKIKAIHPKTEEVYYFCIFEESTQGRFDADFTSWDVLL